MVFHGCADTDFANQVAVGHFYHIFYEGCLTNFEIGDDGAEATLYSHGRVHEKIYVTAKVDLLLACLKESVVVVCDLHPHGRVHEKIYVTAKVDLLLACLNESVVVVCDLFGLSLLYFITQFGFFIFLI